MIEYHHLPSDRLDFYPTHLGLHRCLILIERDVSDEFRNLVSEALVANGCLFSMAWGIDCFLWDDSVDWANISKFEGKEIPDHAFVMTTWHENEPLEDVVRFAKFDSLVSYADKPLDNLLILDFSETDREAQIRSLYNLQD